MTRTLRRHGLPVVVTLGATMLLVEYQPIGFALVSWLPWIGSLVLALNLVLLLEAFLMLGGESDVVRRVTMQLDRVARLSAAVLALAAACVFVNAAFDRAPRTIHRGKVVEIGGRTVTAGVPMVYSWARVRLGPGRPVREFTLALTPRSQHRYWTREAVVVGLRSGAIGLPWVDRLERNDLVYLRRAVEALPRARLLRHRLITFLLRNGAPALAAREIRRYTAAFPADDAFARWAGDNMGLQGRLEDAVALLERADERRPSRYAAFRLAWFLTRDAESGRALAVIQEAAGRWPNAWELPYLAAYNLARMGRYGAALTALDRAIALRTGIPQATEARARLLGLAAPIQSTSP